jgi:hypothetical protein
MCTTRKNISALKKLLRDRGELRLERALTSQKVSANVPYAAVCALCTRKLLPTNRRGICTRCRETPRNKRGRYG